MAQQDVNLIVTKDQLAKLIVALMKLQKGVLPEVRIDAPEQSTTVFILKSNLE